MIGLFGIKFIAAVATILLGILIGLLTEMIFRWVNHKPLSGAHRPIWLLILALTWGAFRDPIAMAICRWQRERVQAQGLPQAPAGRPPAEVELLDGREILTLIREAAEGVPAAECIIATWMEEGCGRFRHDPVAARNLYLDAANKGHGKAQFSLGYCCLKGIGGSADAVEAVKWFRKSAQQGDARAQYWMGRCCQGGIGLAGDKRDAVGWYRMAADRSTAAQISLGIAYALGVDLPRDIPEAFVWFWVSAANGDPMAPRLLQEISDEMPAESLEQALDKAKAEFSRIKAKRPQHWPAAGPGGHVQPTPAR